MLCVAGPRSVYCTWRMMHILDAPSVNDVAPSLCEVVGPGLASTSLAFRRSSDSYPSDPHDRIAPKTVNRAPLLRAGDVDTICKVVCQTL